MPGSLPGILLRWKHGSTGGAEMHFPERSITVVTPIDKTAFTRSYVTRNRGGCMKRSPEGRRVHNDSDPYEEFRRYKEFVAKHKRAQARGERKLRLIRYLRTGAVLVLALVGALALAWGLSALKAHSVPPHPSTWSVSIQGKHMAASQGCDSAHAVGLAPAFRGRPGYWPHLDRDNDGIACETTFLGILRAWIRPLFGTS